MKIPYKRLKREEEKFPVFIFQYLNQDSKQHSFTFFNKGKTRDVIPVYESLLSKLKHLSSIPILELAEVGKTAAFETLPYSNFNEHLQHLFHASGIPRDAKLTVFRFHNQQFRMICSSNDNVFYIIAFDFNFSAYDHGC